MQEQQHTPDVQSPLIAGIIGDHFNPTCAWCLKRRGIEPKETDSHGICPTCAALWLVQEKAKLAERRAAQTAAKCQCKTTPGGTIVCDPCASKTIEVANDQRSHEATLAEVTR